MEKGIRHNYLRYITGIVAMGLALYFMYAGRTAFPLFLASLFCFLICATDTFATRIPNLATLALALAGFGYHFQAAGASGLLIALFGLILGFSLLIVPYILGGMGAGDVKAMAALGALLGPAAIAQVFLYTCLAGGLLSILHYAIARNMTTSIAAGLKSLKTFLYTKDLQALKPSLSGERLRFPYAVAIALGFYTYTYWGSII